MAENMIGIALETLALRGQNELIAPRLDGL